MILFYLFKFTGQCQRDISMKFGGRQIHKDEVSAIINQTSKAAHLGNFAFTSVTDGKKGGKTGEEDNSVINARILFAQFIVEHNLPPTCADHAGKLFRSMFPDSDIAKKLKCAGTKTTALIKHTAETDQSIWLTLCRQSPSASPLFERPGRYHPVSVCCLLLRRANWQGAWLQSSLS